MFADQICEDTEPPDGVQRVEEDEKISSDTAKALQRGQKDNREAHDEPPHQLIVEAELAQTGVASILMLEEADEPYRVLGWRDDFDGPV